MKKNRIVLNIGMNGLMDLPEPGLPAITIDGTPIYNVLAVHVAAEAGEPTRVSFIIHGEVGGFIADDNIEEMIKKATK